VPASTAKTAVNKKLKRVCARFFVTYSLMGCAVTGAARSSDAIV
jgi:hypothetical protein